MLIDLRRTLVRPALLPSLPELPHCASRRCPRPPSLWQRWWARNEGTRLEGRWYCSPDCLYEGVLRSLDSLRSRQARGSASPRHLPLGLVLLSQGAITAEQLRRALHRQRSEGSGKIGEWLVRLGAVSAQQVTNALAAQQRCSVFAPREPSPVPAAMQWPLLLVDAYHAVPVLHSQPQLALYVGFLDGVSHTFLRAAEHVLHCVTQPCIVPADVFHRHRERQMSGALPQNQTIVIQQQQNNCEMAEAIVNYAEQVKARSCTVAACEQRLWARVSAPEQHIDFLFRLADSHGVVDTSGGAAGSRLDAAAFVGAP